MKLQMGKYLLITGLVIFVFIIGELAGFQEGYMRLNHQIDNSAKYQTNAVINEIELLI